MTRAKLEALVEDLITRTLPPCKTALSDAGVSTSDIDEISNGWWNDKNA